MSGAERVGIYGGTFDPPHKGHVSAAEDAVRELGLTSLLIIPAGLPPHKVLPGNTASGQMRLEMAKKAFSHIPGAAFSDWELSRNGKSYTVETLRRWCGQNPGKMPVLLIGTDMLLTFEGWYQFREIFQLCELGVFPRADGDEEMLLQTARRFRQEYGARITVLPHIPFVVSSTEIRRLLGERKGEELLPAEVYAYVVENRLYGCRPSFSWLKEQVLPKLSQHRAAHTLGVEKTAAELAKRYGEREEPAREAAILHDCTKYLNLANQLIICRKYDMINDNYEQCSVNLLHGKTAAALAEHQYGASPEAVSAIRYHTTGRANMSKLEKILYLADMIEPGREFPGVEKLRALAERNLDEALELALQMSLQNLMDRGIAPHPSTVEAAAWMSREARSGKDGHD